MIPLHFLISSTYIFGLMTLFIYILNRYPVIVKSKSELTVHFVDKPPLENPRDPQEWVHGERERLKNASALEIK